MGWPSPYQTCHVGWRSVLAPRVGSQQQPHQLLCSAAKRFVCWCHQGQAMAGAESTAKDFPQVCVMLRGLNHQGN